MFQRRVERVREGATTDNEMDDYRYLILTEGALGPLTSKTANSAIRYVGNRVVPVLDSSRAGSA